MTKLIIWLGGRPQMHGFKIREFKWSPVHGCYIYEGRELSESEFNAVYEKAIKTNEELRPKVRVVPQTETVATTTVSTAPVATITAAREITWQEAEAVLRQLAPHRLKPNLGRPPKVKAVA